MYYIFFSKNLRFFRNLKIFEIKNNLAFTYFTSIYSYKIYYKDFIEIIDESNIDSLVNNILNTYEKTITMMSEGEIDLEHIIGYIKSDVKILDNITEKNCTIVRKGFYKDKSIYEKCNYELLFSDIVNLKSIIRDQKINNIINEE